jgi:hypothetical protein
MARKGKIKSRYTVTALLITRGHILYLIILDWELKIFSDS